MRKIVLVAAVIIGIALPGAGVREEGTATARANVPCIDCWR